jgi:hypothetical protein
MGVPGALPWLPEYGTCETSLCFLCFSPGVSERSWLVLGWLLVVALVGGLNSL